MKRFWFPLLVFVAFVVGLIASCEEMDYETAARTIRMSDFKFGYYAKPEFDLSSVSTWMVNTNGDENYICFTSEEEIEDIRSGKYKSMLSSTAAARQDIIDSANFKNSRLEFSLDPIELYVEPFPKKAVVHTVEVESLNPDIVEVIPKEDYEKYGHHDAHFSFLENRVFVRCHKLGEVEFVVKVTGLTFSETRHYKVRCVTTVKPKFLITNKLYAKAGGVGVPYGCRIWMALFNIPDGIFEIPPLIWIKDSVSIFSYCEYYNFERAGRKPIIYRDTLGLPQIGRFFVPFPGLRCLHSVDLTAAMISMEGIAPIEPWGIRNCITGTKEIYVNNDKIIVPWDYPILVDQVKLSWEVYSDCPYLEFKGKTFSFFSPDKSEYSYASSVSSDSTSMQIDNIDEVVEEKKAWFDLQLMMKYKPSQMDSIANDIDMFKKSVGLDRMTVSNEEDRAEYERRANEGAEIQKKYW